MKLLVIGAGNMGLTYAKAINNFGIMGDNKIMILDKSPEKLAELRADNVFEVFEELSDCLPQAQMIMVAVKPQHKDGLFKDMKPHLRADALIISVMAGITIENIQKALGVLKVVRAMPNLPAQVGLGMTTFFPDESVSLAEEALVEKLLASTGQSLRIFKEDDINTSTAVSGSGPAYIFYFIEGMLKGAKHYGYDDATAKKLVTQTFAGTLELFNRSDLSTTEWMDKVASKGGTTREALNTFEKEGISEGIQKGMIACYDRAIELSKM